MKVAPGVMVSKESFKHAELLRIFLVMQEEAPVGYEITLVSACDGRHSRNSKHYKGFAFDFSIENFPAYCTALKWVKRVQDRLGMDYFVSLEQDKGNIHTQWNGGEK